MSDSPAAARSSPSASADAVLDVESAAPHGEPCSACGCPVEPLDKFCPACGTPHQTVVTATVIATQAIATQKGAPKPDAERLLRCDTCGAQISDQSASRSIVCPFCDSTYVVELDQQQPDRQRPEFVIGFAITPEKAQQQFVQWMRRNGWFRPGDLLTSMAADKMKGMYLPFWGFSLLAESDWSVQIGEYWYRTETYTTTDSKGKVQTHTRQVRETEWWPLSGRHHRYYSGYLVSGSKGLAQKEATTIMPFNLPALKRFEPYFLAGWLCEEYSVGPDKALQAAHQEFFRREHENIKAFLPGDTNHSLNVQTRFSQENSDLCVLPVYILTYRYRGKLFQFLLNGQTGKCFGRKPISWRRISMAVLAIVGAVDLGRWPRCCNLEHDALRVEVGGCRTFCCDAPCAAHCSTRKTCSAPIVARKHLIEPM